MVSIRYCYSQLSFFLFHCSESFSIYFTSNLKVNKCSIILIFIWFYIHWNWFLEPGYYEDGAFGIRLENVLVINEADTKFNFGDKGYLSFEHITWVSPNLCITFV